MTNQKINFRYEAPPMALERWNPAIKAANKEDESTINIYSTIGEYGDGSGMTAKIVSAILRKNEDKDINVNINSPGGDFFEGLAIHSLLSQHDGRVKIRVLGMAASAASVIAMAGDDIEIAENAFFMIHNSWTFAMGNRNDMEKTADMLGKFDKSMSKLYAAKTGMEEKAIIKMMDEETWIDGEKAIDLGFATALIGEDEIDVEDDEKDNYNAALKKVDVTLAKAGMPRSERRELIRNLTGTPCAAEPKPCAGLQEALAGLYKTITS